MAATASGETPNKLQGVWKIVEVKTSGPNASTDSSPQPGMFFFAAKHYSFIRIFGQAPRPDLPADLTKATASELYAVWNPFGANAGTYEVTGDKMTCHPAIAKNPSVMANGAKVVATFKLEGNSLWITTVSTVAGPAKDPETLKLVRLE